MSSATLTLEKIGLTPEIDFAIFPPPLSPETLADGSSPEQPSSFRTHSSTSLHSLVEKGEFSLRVSSVSVDD